MDADLPRPQAQRLGALDPLLEHRRRHAPAQHLLLAGVVRVLQLQLVRCRQHAQRRVPAVDVREGQPDHDRVGRGGGRVGVLQVPIYSILVEGHHRAVARLLREEGAAP